MNSVGFRELFRRLFGEPIVLPQDEQPRLDGEPAELHVLVIADEWDSAHGGISTFNRQLCCAMAEKVWICCVVRTASDAELRRARKSGVTLIPWSDGSEPPDLSKEPGRLDLPEGFRPAWIFGHSRITGPLARRIAETQCRDAKRLHFLHSVPDLDERNQADGETSVAKRAEDRTQTELELGRDADLVVALGPLLHDWYQNQFWGHRCALPKRLDPGFDFVESEPQGPPPGNLRKILLVGRAVKTQHKGLDIGARAVGLAARRRGNAAAALKLVIRGAPEEVADALEKQVRAWSGLPSLDVFVRPYSSDVERLSADLRMASLVIMPSRSEGFGLAAREAIVAGTPILISSTSGLGNLLREVLPDEETVQRFVVEMTGDDQEDTDRWARAIESVLRDRDAAFVRAAELRTFMASRLTWGMAVDRLMCMLAEG